MLATNALFGAVLCMLLILLVSAKNEPIDFALQELRGDVYQRPLEKAMHGIARHRIVAQRALHGDKPAQGQIEKIQAKVDEAMIEVAKADADVGVALQFTDEGLKQRKREHMRAKTVTAEWTDLKAKLQRMKPEQSNEAHAHLISDLRTMITHSGDTSNLILDPDLDSYYLMDVTLLALPQAQDRIQNVITEIEPIVRRRKTTQAERIKLSVFASMMREADLERIKADYQTVLNEDPNFYGSIETLTSVLGPAHNKFVEAYGEFIDLVQGMAEGEAIEAGVDKFLARSDRALAESFKYWDVAAAEMDKLLDTRVGVIRASQMRSTTFSALALLGYMIFAWFFARRLSSKLSAVVETLVGESTQVGTSAVQISSASQDLAQASAEQASALQETAASIEEMNTMIRKSSENAVRSRDVSTKSHDATSMGKQAVLQRIQAIEDISECNGRIMAQVDESNRQMTEIAKVINEVGNKTKVINDIVFQTKLLSFNASVEAARAGEHGKGFAVVAEEVGNLAQMSGNAAKEISEMLTGSIQKVEAIVTETRTKVERLINEGRAKVDSGTAIARQCGDVLEQVVQNVGEVNGMVSEIATASQEQSLGVSEITRAMSELDHVTHQNASTSQQTSTLASNLQHQADSLRKVVSTLVQVVQGRGVVRTSSASHTATVVPFPTQVESQDHHDRKSA
jgi:methyl-accepting chemotaxis protein